MAAAGQERPRGRPLPGARGVQRRGAPLITDAAPSGGGQTRPWPRPGGHGTGRLWVGEEAAAKNPDTSLTPHDIAHAAAGPGWLYGAFQLTSSLLLLAAASSSFQAGPGLLKALAGTFERPGVLPPVLGRANSHHTPYWSVVVHLAAAALIIVAAAGQEQKLVLFYAVAVFVSFLVGLVAMARFARRENKTALAWVNGLAAVAVAFTLVVNLLRGRPTLTLAATVLIAAGLYVRWTRAGRPTGIEDVEARAEAT